MFLAQIWRYPVKSMKGEPLEHAHIGFDGIEGDRIVQVRNQGGRIVTARTRPALLRHRGTLGPDGAPLVDERPWNIVDERPWNTPEVLRDVEAAAGPGAYLTLDYGAERFECAPTLRSNPVTMLDAPQARHWYGQQVR